MWPTEEGVADEVKCPLYRRIRTFTSAMALPGWALLQAGQFPSYKTLDRRVGWKNECREFMPQVLVGFSPARRAPGTQRLRECNAYHKFHLRILLKIFRQDLDQALNVLFLLVERGIVG